MATDITIATAENIISQPCTKEDIELNLRRMFSVLTSKYSRQMYDRHIAIFNRLCRFYRSIRETEIGIDKQTPGYQESLIFTFNGKNESDTICQLMIEGFQRAIEGGGLPLAAALTDLISIICAVIGERESFETEECTDIENFLATLTKLLSLKPTFDEDINEEGRKGIEVVVDFVSGCVFKSLLSWLITTKTASSDGQVDKSKPAGELVLRLSAPRLLSASNPEFKCLNSHENSAACRPQIKLIERSNIAEECVKFLVKFHTNQEKRIFILRLLYYALPSAKILTKLAQEHCATEMLKIISDGYKAQSNDNYSSFTDFERSLALEIVWALVESRESQAVLAELGEMHNLICIRKILAPFDVDKQSHRPQDKQIRNDLALVLLRLASSTQFSATRSAYQSSQQLSSSKNIAGEKSRISLSRPSSSGAGNNNRPKSVTFASEKIDWLQVARAASDNIINSASNPSSHDAFIQSGLTEMLTERLRTDQCLSDTVKDPRQPNTKHDEDYLLTRIFLQIAAQFCRSLPALNHMLSKGLLALCFDHFKIADGWEGKDYRWTQHQRLAVRQEILGLLQVILHQAPEMFFEIDGPVMLCRFVQASFEQRFTAPGDAVPEVEHNALIGSVLRFLLFIVDKIPDHQGPLVNLGMMDLCLDVLRKKRTKLDLVYTSFLICSSLCRDNRYNRKLFGKVEGVQTVIGYLSKISPDQEETERIRLVCFEAIWTCIVGNSANETLFMQLDGVYKILDILAKERSQKVQRHLLGAFLDLLENPKARSHALEWRYNECPSEKKSVVNLLVQLWKNEEKYIACEEQSQTGFIRVEVFPLRGSKQSVAHPRDTVKNSQAVVELYDNLRAKIFATLSKLGFENLDNYLSVEEQIRFKKIQKYLDFKIGEVWEEIKNELEYEGVRPTSPDEECLQTSRQMIVKKAENIYSKQYEIAKKKQDKEKEEERYFYAEFIDSHTMHSYQKQKEPAVARVQTVSRKSLEHS